MALVHTDYVSRPNVVGGAYNTFWAPDGTAFTRFASTYTTLSAPATPSPLWPAPAAPAADLAQFIWRASPPATDFSAGVILQFELVDPVVFNTTLGIGATVDAVVYVMADNAFNIEVQFRRSVTTATLTQIFTLSDNPLPINTPVPFSQPFGWQNVYIYYLTDVFNGAVLTGEDIDIDFRGKVSNYAPGAAAAATNTAGIMLRMDVLSLVTANG
ncbi:MAG: hypothetical protein VR69_01965 [Peptococcaceae bacterium BRH_c4b]|nr:MAG: hypothetical protein VR69_06060 [Peptococcaceae bacterium BRH_c4b]KJS18201.1 MAG: hypothetical protein VR69_01965 [Peptococcaceae bacterium BRH_c4b]